MTAPTVLALDLSLTATGWATSPVLRDLIPSSAGGGHHGVATGPGKLRGPDRLIAWGGWLLDYALASFPDLVAIEGYAYGRHNQMAAIAEWGGVARYLLHANNIPYVVVPPATLKKFATGKGNATKPDMRMALYKRLGLDVADDNAVDALWLLAAARQAYGYPLVDMPKDQILALNKVEWPELDEARSGA